MYNYKKASALYAGPTFFRPFSYKRCTALEKQYPKLSDDDSGSPHLKGGVNDSGAWIISKYLKAVFY
jgi:hypothetical protein